MITEGEAMEDSRKEWLETSWGAVIMTGASWGCSAERGRARGQTPGCFWGWKDTVLPTVG